VFHTGGNVHVLVVEDQAVVREAIAATFDRETGFTVDSAGSQAEARGMLEGVDVVILDLGLPDGNGADLIPELHAANPDGTAIILTSSVDPTDVDRALRRGAAAVLNKLDGLDEALATVKRLQ
jgi:two-component system nitrogen regulation response regulator GlnG